MQFVSTDNFFKKYLSYLGIFRGPPVEKLCSKDSYCSLESNRTQ